MRLYVQPAESRIICWGPYPVTYESVFIVPAPVLEHTVQVKSSEAYPTGLFTFS